MTTNNDIVFFDEVSSLSNQQRKDLYELLTKGKVNKDLNYKSNIVIVKDISKCNDCMYNHNEVSHMQCELEDKTKCDNILNGRINNVSNERS